jgi:hypothetical protein
MPSSRVEALRREQANLARQLRRFIIERGVDLELPGHLTVHEFHAEYPKGTHAQLREAAAARECERSRITACEIVLLYSSDCLFFGRLPGMDLAEYRAPVLQILWAMGLWPDQPGERSPWVELIDEYFPRSIPAGAEIQGLREEFGTPRATVEQATARFLSNMEELTGLLVAEGLQPSEPDILVIAELVGYREVAGIAGRESALARLDSRDIVLHATDRDHPAWAAALERLFPPALSADTCTPFALPLQHSAHR